ncbi:hypothetical protein L2Y96_07735 [Luteibacter aegosomaticola]|uniref:hypothetical protein n=1 Tax=Luteibacter aegosomaticola TaxID=2911538 RepID=UPI001FF82CE3|nr:hypothetical protein [Luteibacter aegosomaticola]UPG91646.1 hypothetical protein L2Y96_07735 [Luteibacter aegosomaticola]
MFCATREHGRHVAAHRHAREFPGSDDIAKGIRLRLRRGKASAFKDGKDDRKILTAMVLAEHTATAWATA